MRITLSVSNWSNGKKLSNKLLYINLKFLRNGVVRKNWHVMCDYQIFFCNFLCKTNLYGLFKLVNLAEVKTKSVNPSWIKFVKFAICHA